MAPYLIAPGHDVALGSLQPFNIEPSGEAVTPAERKYGLSGKVHDYGLCLALHWNYFEESTDYYTMLELVGLESVDSCPVTVYARNKRYAFVRWNGIAQLPVPGEDAKLSNFFIRDINLYITHMVELIEP